MPKYEHEETQVTSHSSFSPPITEAEVGCDHFLPEKTAIFVLLPAGQLQRAARGWQHSPFNTINAIYCAHHQGQAIFAISRLEAAPVSASTAGPRWSLSPTTPQAAPRDWGWPNLGCPGLSLLWHPQPAKSSLPSLSLCTLKDTFKFGCNEKILSSQLGINWVTWLFFSRCVGAL